MNTNKTIQVLETIEENLQLAECRVLSAIYDLLTGKDTENISENKGLIAILEHGAYNIDRICKDQGIDLNYTPIDRSSIALAEKFEKRLEKFRS